MQIFNTTKWKITKEEIDDYVFCKITNLIDRMLFGYRLSLKFSLTPNARLHSEKLLFCLIKKFSRLKTIKFILKILINKH
jgi:hypothetical protein